MKSLRNGDSQESALDNLEIKQEEIDIDDIIHLDFQQDIHIQKKVKTGDFWRSISGLSHFEGGRGKILKIWICFPKKWI